MRATAATAGCLARGGTGHWCALMNLLEPLAREFSAAAHPDRLHERRACLPADILRRHVAANRNLAPRAGELLSLADTLDGLPSVSANPEVYPFLIAARFAGAALRRCAHRQDPLARGPLGGPGRRADAGIPPVEPRAWRASGGGGTAGARGGLLGDGGGIDPCLLSAAGPVPGSARGGPLPGRALVAARCRPPARRRRRVRPRAALRRAIARRAVPLLLRPGPDDGLRDGALQLQPAPALRGRAVPEPVSRDAARPGGRAGARVLPPAPLALVVAGAARGTARRGRAGRLRPSRAGGGRCPS